MVTLKDAFSELILAAKRIAEHPKKEVLRSQYGAVATALMSLKSGEWEDGEKLFIHNFWCCVLASRHPGSWERWRNPQEYGEVELRADTCRERFLLVSKNEADERELKDARAFALALHILSKKALEAPSLSRADAVRVLLASQGTPQERAAKKLGVKLIIGGKR